MSDDMTWDSGQIELLEKPPAFAEPKPQSAAQRKKATQEADRMTLLLERLSARLLGYALARLDSQQFMAVGQPRDDHGKWTKDGGAVAAARSYLEGELEDYERANLVGRSGASKQIARGRGRNEAYLESRGHSQEAITEAKDLLWRHDMGSSNPEIQASIDQKLADAFHSDTPAGAALRDISAREQAALDLYKETRPQYIKNEFERANADWEYSGKQGDPPTIASFEKQVQQQMLIYRGGGSKDVEAWTNDSRGAQTSGIVGGASVRIKPDRSMSLEDLDKNGYALLGGIASLRGATGESEVLLVRKEAIKAGEQQFMAVGQPRDDHGKWTKGAVAFASYEDAKSVLGERNVPEGRLLGAATMYQTGWAVAVNSDLRAGKKLSGDKKYVVDAMDEMFAKHSIAIDSDVILHRKVRGRLPEEFSDAGFVSTSATHSFAASYEPPKNGRWYAKPDPTDVHMIEIRVPAGTKMLSLLKQGLGQDGKMTEIPEVVLNRGTKFVSDGPGKLRAVK